MRRLIGVMRTSKGLIRDRATCSRYDPLIVDGHRKTPFSTPFQEELRPCCSGKTP